MKKDKIKLVLIIYFSILLLIDIILLLTSLYYSAFIFFIGIFASYIFVYIFDLSKLVNTKMKDLIFIYTLRLFFVAMISVFISLIWYYIEVIKTSVHPLFLICFPLMVVIIYYINVFLSNDR